MGFLETSIMHDLEREYREKLNSIEDPKVARGIAINTLRNLQNNSQPWYFVWAVKLAFEYFSKEVTPTEQNVWAENNPGITIVNYRINP